MPMRDAYIPEGALSPSAERELLGRTPTCCSVTTEFTRPTRRPER
jgi:hypothetical protein